MYDTHCHLTDLKIAPDFLEVVNQAIQNDVTKMIMPSTNLTDCEDVIKRVDNRHIFGVVGVHPEHVEDTSDIKSVIRVLKEMAKNDGIVGIGECGLDFYFDKEKRTKDKQVDLLKAQIELALEIDLPIVLHNRNSTQEMVEVLRPYKDLKVQMHCFDGSAELLHLGADREYYFSFCGNLTYKNNEVLVEALKQVPLNRLLLETDSPYLAPMPMRGQVNRPVNVRMIAEFIAMTLNKKHEEIGTLTSDNAQLLFERL
jgi:TatD DNase family protein